MPVSNLCCFFGSQITNGIRNILKIAPDIGHLPIVAFLLFAVVSKGDASRFLGTWHCLLFKLPSGRHAPIEVTPVCVHVVCACSSLSGHSAWQAALQVRYSQHKRLPGAIPVKRNRLEQKQRYLISYMPCVTRPAVGHFVHIYPQAPGDAVQ